MNILFDIFLGVHTPYCLVFPGIDHCLPDAPNYVDGRDGSSFKQYVFLIVSIISLGV
jgi:hypothetical protein